MTCSSCGRDIRPNNARRHAEIHAPGYAAKAAERFWSMVDRRGADECWEWQGHRTRQGYGQVAYAASHMQAHRLSWQLTNGPIPDGLWALHHCDNPPCCNPAHLYLGTVVENTRDMCARGRAPRGPVVRDHCRRGHELTPENTIVNRGNGRRQCRRCHNDAKKRQWQARAALAEGSGR